MVSFVKICYSVIFQFSNLRNLEYNDFNKAEKSEL